jgi:hypothetical protein
VRTGRRLRVAAALAGVVALLLLALNVTGLAPIPTGPLGDHAATVPDPGGVSTLDFEPKRSRIYLSAVVENAGPVPVTVVRVTAVGVSVPGSVAILGSLPFNSDDPAEQQQGGLPTILLGVQPDPGPGWASPQPVTGGSVAPQGKAQYKGRAFLVRVTQDPTRVTAVLRVDVEYTIGPLHFLTTAWGPIGTTVIMCPRDRPTAGENGCGAG